MVYFNETKEGIEKYEISFDVNEVIKLRDEIDKNCSLLMHKETTSEYDPSFKNRRILNYHYEKVGEKEYFEEVRPIYHYEWDEYVSPEIIFYINELLNGNVHYAFKILLYKNSKNSIDEQIASLKSKLANINSVYEAQKLIDEYSRLEELKENNKDVKNVDQYLEKFKSMINIQQVNFLSREEYEKAKEYFNVPLKTSCETKNKAGIKLLLQRKNSGGYVCFF